MNSNEMFNEMINIKNKNVEKLNKQLKVEYEKHGGLDLFTKYVMSETLAPIENYENVVKLIRENYQKHISVELLIIGAYLTVSWMCSDNEMLEVLNLIRPFLSDHERAIVHYLNAYRMFIADNDYLLKQEYKTELYSSLISNVAFVNNRLKLVELASEEARDLYIDALNNVQIVFSEDNKSDVSIECLLNPQSFINEFILGNYMHKENYDNIILKMMNL